MYYLLPFRFDRIAGRELLINEAGEYLVVPDGTVQNIVDRKLDPASELFRTLLARFFVSLSPIPETWEQLAIRLRTKKSFLSEFTSLHIFVLTLRCNQNCSYCQASSKPADAVGFDMSKEHLDMAISLMFRSPARALTMEFQGGESSLAPELLQYAVLKAEEYNSRHGKNITYVLCTNSLNLSDELLCFCRKFQIRISTSLDGPEFLHDLNRGNPGGYRKLAQNLSKIRSICGPQGVAALMTASCHSLSYPREIIDCYLENGFNGIFLRPLNPYGVVRNQVDWPEYYRNFLSFYFKAFEHILSINQNGIFFSEELAKIIMQKVLTPFSAGFVDMQSPSGLVNSVVVYHYDGWVYASDESRMLAEDGDYTFRLGHVSEPYEQLFFGRKAQQLALLGGTEYIAGCSDCVFQSCCGADPVRNYVEQRDEYGFRPASLSCSYHQNLFRYLFSLLIEREREVVPIFRRWLTLGEK